MRPIRCLNYNEYYVKMPIDVLTSINSEKNHQYLNDNIPKGDGTRHP